MSNLQLVKKDFYTKCSIMLLVFLCCGFFVIASSKYPCDDKDIVFLPTKQVGYRWTSSVYFNELHEDNISNVGFSLQGKLLVSHVWGNEENDILKLELKEIEIEKGPQEGALKTVKNVDANNEPFFIVVNTKSILRLFIAKNENNLRNIKKGVSNLFQTGTSEHYYLENSSETCKVSYTCEDFIRKKEIQQCTDEDLNTANVYDPILGVKILSNRLIEYSFTNNDHVNFVQGILHQENHRVLNEAREELVALIKVEQTLKYEDTQDSVPLNVNNLEDAIKQLHNEDFEEESLSIKANHFENRGKNDFRDKVAALRHDLTDKHLGKLQSAKAFLSLIDLARSSATSEISKVLTSKKNNKILPQLYDILGYAQTKNSHLAVMKHLHLDNEDHKDLMERYLWALSFSTQPNKEVFEDLLDKLKKYINLIPQVKTTLLLTLSSMANKIASSKNTDQFKISKTMEETLINGFDYAKNDDRLVYLRSFINLKSPTALTKLQDIIRNGTIKEEVLAWRAINSIDKSYWTKEILQQARKTLFQLDRKHDSSARTLASNILLQAGLNSNILEDLLEFVACPGSDFEVKQYVWQNLKMLADISEIFNAKLKTTIKNNKKLNNYSGLSPRGLSTALTRTVFSGSLNASLVSIQEISVGIVKRGVVDLILNKADFSKQIFTLGIFSSGLSSFTSSNDEDSQDEIAAAGMELTILDTQIRPFVFFEGQGELMGHVWSGTASEITPAFQVITLIQDYKKSLRLGNGFIIEVDIKTVVSFDLSGQITISIWNRNAQSLIKKSVGWISSGSLRLLNDLDWDSDFVFEESLEPELTLNIDADFSNNVKLCMRLSQQTSTYRRRLTGKRYQTEKIGDRNKEIPGFTYALNRKNSEMCNSMFP
ncbi:hypothetical protein ABEB36_008445 [Hypothenemus hampei]|uniref:Vitellogenin domain-containing protein n=1 Tax=Hypothenemus hampei TaxID=57062 RepID=A0ABD1EPT5_HYPHA